MNSDEDLLLLGDEGRAGTSGGPAQTGTKQTHDKQPTAKKSLTEFFAELTSSNSEVKEGALTLTKDFMKSKDRELIHTKKIELETQLAIYKREYNDLPMEQVSESNKNILVAQKASMDNYELIIKKFVQDAAAIDKGVKNANDAVEEISIIFDKLKNQKRVKAHGFLQTASVRDLRKQKANYEAVYMDYLKNYLRIRNISLMRY